MGWQDAPEVAAPTSSGSPAWMGAPEVAPEQPASLADKMVGGWGGRMAMGIASPVLAATQMLGGEKGRELVAALDAMKQRGMKAEGKDGFDWYALLGSLAPGAGIANGVTAALPAATTALGRIGTGAAIGAATSAAQPVAESPNFWTDKAKQVGVGTAVGGAIPAVGEALMAAKGAPPLNPVKAATLAEGQQAGYVVPPSSVNPSFLNNRLESIAGKAAVGQEAAKRNQEITNAMAAKSLGLAPDTSITEGVLNQVRKNAGKPYADIAKLTPEAADTLETLKQARFMGNKYKMFSDRSGDPAAYVKAEELKKTAGMMEQHLESMANAAGRPDLVAALPEARKAIAKSYDVERALNLGDSNISAAVIGRKFDKAGAKGMTGELATIGKMAQAFPSVMREGARVPASGVSGTDAAASALLGTVGAIGGGPMGILAGGLPLLRGPARSLVLSKAYQNFATADPSKYQAIIDALSQHGAGAAGTDRREGQPVSDNGSGVAVINSAGQPVVATTLITAAAFNALTADLSTMLSNRICKDGQTTITANIPFSGFKATGLGAGSARTDAASLATIQDGTGVYVATVGGTADVITLTPAPAITAYAAGQTFRFIASGANTTNVTVAISGLTAKAITKNGTTALVAGDIPSSSIVTITFDGTQFILSTITNLANATLTSPTLAGTPVFPDNVFTIGGSADASKKLAFEVDGITTATTRTATAPDYNIRLGNLPAGIGPLPYAGASIPTGWLECDGSSVLRATYADLFTAIGTTWGSVDGTHFTLPDMRGRLPIGAGTGVTVEVSTASSSNGFTVTANNTKWITGMPVVWSALSGFTTSGSAGPTYYAVRVSSTNVRYATTLALAQAGTPDVTISGSGSCTVTYTMTARTLGEQGGEESHAMSSTELLAHTHTEVKSQSPGGTWANGADAASVTVNSGSAGGNVAMNIRAPFLVTKYIISY